MDVDIDEDEPSVLVIVIDADPASWQQIHCKYWMDADADNDEGPH